MSSTQPVTLDASHAGANPLRVLLIDDDEVDFRATRRMLTETFGTEVALDWVYDWSDATKAFAQSSYDVYLIDYFLGGKTGLELVEGCDPSDKPSVFIFLTGHDDRKVDIAATNAGASGYLVKADITASTLERTIRYALFMAGKKEELQRETIAVKAAKDIVERQSEMHAKMATDLSATQAKLRSALKSAEESEQKYRNLAQHDLLTELPNRVLFMSQLERMIDHAHRSGKDMALLLLDLDRFKSINDTLGHPVGDRLLMQVAKRLTDCTRKTDTVARLGGDEFAVIVTNLQSHEDTAIVAQHIIESLTAPFEIEGHEINTSASVGIAILNEDSDAVEALLKNADAALYKAKDAGRGVYHFFDAALNNQVRTITLLKRELSEALEHHQFFLEYQPQIETSTNKVTGVEALVRWQHPTRGRVPPCDFIPTAESTGQIAAMSEWILKEACSQSVEWERMLGCSIPVAVNLSAIQFKRGRLVETIATILSGTGLPPASLTLEITETVMIHDVDEVEMQLRDLVALGVKIAIDDFGTGYSSLAHVRQLPIDQIKVDRSFVSDMLSNHRDAAVVEAVIALGRNLGVTVVAEGVETIEQMDYLRKMPSIDAQGFFIARPMLPSQCQKWLSRNLQPELKMSTEIPCAATMSALTRAS